jgi:hypothetical protein
MVTTLQVFKYATFELFLVRLKLLIHAYSPSKTSFNLLSIGE